MPDASITPPAVSASSRRVARNTVLLYFRMLLLMFIGLFTSRVVLKNLGVTDYGVYNAVGGMVMMFTLVTASVSQAISRFLAFELGKSDDSDRLHRIFATSVVVQILFCAVVILLAETLGLFFLNSCLNIPEGRTDAAFVVLQCSAGVLCVNLLSVPFNSCIIAHERMGAFAGISILEAVMKLSVAVLLAVSHGDKLVIYAILMLAVAVVVRFSYGFYCSRHFTETRGGLILDNSLLKEMISFAGWNFFGQAGYIFNTQGVNVLSNIFFGVGVSAARGIAAQVENIVRQFVTNFTTALNPQITKSFASENREYCFHLVNKGAKFSYLVILMLGLPLFFEAPFLLDLWLDDVPEGAALFCRLTILGLAADMLGNSLAHLELATGNIKKYYIIIGSVSLLAFILSWVAFLAGAPASVAYVVFAAVYSVLLVLKLLILRSQVGFPVKAYFRDVILKVLACTVFSTAFSAVPFVLIREGWTRSVAVCFACVISVAAFSYLFALTPGEKAWVKQNIRKNENR